MDVFKRIGYFIHFAHWTHQEKRVLQISTFLVMQVPLWSNQLRACTFKPADFLLTPRTHERHENNLMIQLFYTFLILLDWMANSNNTKSAWKVFDKLRKMYSLFYSHSFSNVCVWEKVFLGQCAECDPARLSVATTPKLLHRPILCPGILRHRHRKKLKKTETERIALQCSTIIFTWCKTIWQKDSHQWSICIELKLQRVSEVWK